MPGSSDTGDFPQDNDGHVNMAGNFTNEVFSIATVAGATGIPSSIHPKTPSPASAGAGGEPRHGTGVMAPPITVPHRQWHGDAPAAPTRL